MNQKRLPRRNVQGGFTVIELLVCVAIVAILGVAGTSLWGQVFGDTSIKGTATQVIKDLNTINDGVQSFQNSNKTSPTALTDLTGTTGDLKALPTPPSGIGAYTWDNATYKAWKDTAKEDTIVKATVTSVDVCSKINELSNGVAAGTTPPAAVDGALNVQCIGASSPYTVLIPVIAQ